MLLERSVIFLTCLTSAYSQYCQCNTPDDHVESRILFGTRAAITEHPYFAAVDGCGASILSDRWLLTAAHCVENIKNGVAYVGGERLDNSISVMFQAVVIHPDYARDSMTHDIALLQLQRPLNFTDKIQPIQLPKNFRTEKYPLFLVGRGTNEYGIFSRSLMKLALEELSAKDCNKYARNLGYRSIVTDTNTICTKRASMNGPSGCYYLNYHCHVATSAADTSTQAVTGNLTYSQEHDNLPGSYLIAAICEGDSGSPLVQNRVVVGVAAHIMHGDCRFNTLTIFTRVSSFLPWIYQVTGLQ